MLGFAATFAITALAIALAQAQGGEGGQGFKASEESARGGAIALLNPLRQVHVREWGGKRSFLRHQVHDLREKERDGRVPPRRRGAHPPR